jgi:hypothetical protein
MRFTLQLAECPSPPFIRSQFDWCYVDGCKSRIVTLVLLSQSDGETCTVDVCRQHYDPSKHTPRTSV